MKKPNSKYFLAPLKLRTNLKLLPVTRFKDLQAAILTVKMLTGIRF
jgi:hypothetical protein